MVEAAKQCASHPQGKYFSKNFKDWNIYSLCLRTRFPGREREWTPISFPQDSFTFRSRREEWRLSNWPEQLSTRRSEGRQRREVRQSFRPETKERETFSRKRNGSDRTISLPGKRFLSRGMHFLSWEGFSERLVGQNYKMAKKLTYLQYALGQCFKWMSAK